MKNRDIDIMQMCINIAKSNLNYTDSNPSVGCIITDDYNNILYTGTTQINGRPHAERFAISKMLEENIYVNIATKMYVTLEPCCHYGKSPPCIEIILQTKIKTVFISTLDCDSRVNGKGVKFLNDNGITTNVGLLEKETINDLYYFSS